MLKMPSILKKKSLCVCKSEPGTSIEGSMRRKNIDEVETSKEYKDRKKGERIEDWIGKELHGQFRRETEELSSESWSWIKICKLKKETEGLIFAAQDQAITTNIMKARIEKQNVPAMCRVCGNQDKTVQHILLAKEA